MSGILGKNVQPKALTNYELGNWIHHNCGGACGEIAGDCKDSHKDMALMFGTFSTPAMFTRTTQEKQNEEETTH